MLRKCPRNLSETETLTRLELLVLRMTSSGGSSINNIMFVETNKNDNKSYDTNWTKRLIG